MHCPPRPPLWQSTGSGSAGGGVQCYQRDPRTHSVQCSDYNTSQSDYTLTHLAPSTGESGALLYFSCTLSYDIVVHQLPHELMFSLVIHIYTDGTYLPLLSNAVPQLSQFYNSKHLALSALNVRVQCTRCTDACITLTAWHGVCNAHTV